MPDLDKIERKLPPAWRTAYALVKGEQPVEEVARAVLKALTWTLREQGGTPRLRELTQVLQRRDAGLLQDRSLASVALRLEQAMDRRVDKLAVAALLRPEESGPTSLLRGPAGERLAQGFLERMIENLLFSQQRDYLIAKRFTSRDHAIAFETELMAALNPHLLKLARRLLKDPLARRLSAPPVPRQKKKTTKELLDQPL